MKPLKWMFAGLALLLVVSQTHAENRTVLVQVMQDKDKKTSVAIYSARRKNRSPRPPWTTRSRSSAK